MITLGIIREGKVPPDSRVALIPEQVKAIEESGQFKVLIQPSPNRCYSDEEYKSQGLALSEDMESCDYLIGIKEVPKSQLIADKKYFFFSHTFKKQPYNQALLQKIIDDKITLMDYEVLTNDDGKRVIAFGYFAGMVGAHNALYTYAQRTQSFSLKRLKDCFDYKEATEIYKATKFPPVKIVLTGTGRVGSGAKKVLLDMGVKEVSKTEFLGSHFDYAVFTQLAPLDYVRRKDGVSKPVSDFFENPTDYESIFDPYTKVSDIMINGIYWDNAAPAFFTIPDMATQDFTIKVISDVTCDIAPVSSIPSTLKASTIADPIFGFDPATGKETTAHQDHVIDMMTIDNLPNELPRDASKAFGEMFTEHVLQELAKEESDLLTRSTIAVKGKLGKYFEYLDGYVTVD